MPVQLVIDECVAAPRAEIERLCAIELGTTPLPPDSPATEATRLLVLCRGDAIELQVEDPLTGKSLQRLLSLGELDPESRARLVALALAELATASWAELTLLPLLSAERSKASSTTQRAARSFVERRLQPVAGKAFHSVSIAAEASVMIPLSSARPVLPGAGLAMRGVHSSGMGLGLELFYHRGSQSTDLGTVSTDLLSASGSLFYQKSWGSSDVRGAFHLGPGLRAGWARLSGEPSGPDVVGSTLSAGTLGIYGQMGLELMRSGLVLRATIEGGYVVVPVLAQSSGATLSGVDGGWFGLRLGIGGGK